VKYQDAVIAWTPGTNQIRVGPLLRLGDGDWTAHPICYRHTPVVPATQRRETARISSSAT
jgi:hypothetical protein